MSDEASAAGSRDEDELFVFPSWHNQIPPIVFGVVGPLLAVLVIGGIWYYFSPRNTDVGYRPEQPVAYSHKLHAGDMAIDCRYCHVGVERGPVAGVPPTETCMNCHASVKTDSPKLLPVRESFRTGDPLKWVRVHKTPDYAYFDHSAHIAAAIGCESCHGRVDQMPVVQQVEPLNMQWCLDCHMAPEEHLRPTEHVTTMGYDALQDVGKPQLEVGEEIKQKKGINPPLHCSGCHR